MTLGRSAVTVGAMAALAVLICSCSGRRRHTVEPSTQFTAIAPGRERESRDDPRYQAAMAGMRKRLDRAGIAARFHMVVEPPFVIAGDEAPHVVEKRAARVVRWAVEHMRRAYFSRDPEPGLEIWLFRDPDSYRRHTRALFGHEPTTPYGFFDSSHNALIMDISTGGGTLVHEIVHPYMAANFPRCPAWFNEGLGSLYEQAAEREGAIVGQLNWRLPGLQRGLEQGTAPRLRQVLASDAGEFYGDPSGLYYAAARYLLYYLQERGLLFRYYAEFAAAYERDPTGIETLLEVTGQDLPRLESAWRRFVLGQRWYP
jgi:hypothetical protein